jgi:hypothetical protein
MPKLYGPRSGWPGRGAPVPRTKENPFPRFPSWCDHISYNAREKTFFAEPYGTLSRESQLDLFRLAAQGWDIQIEPMKSSWNPPATMLISLRKKK